MERVHTKSAPEAVGPYSQAVVSGEWVFTAGQVGIDPAAGALVDGGVEAQAEQVMKNLAEVLQAAGSSFDQVVRSTIYLASMDSFQAVNAIYAAALGDHRPARSTVEAAGLPLGALVEIDMIAHKAV